MWIIWLEKKILKTLGIILGIIIILITALHIYVVNNAEKLLEDIVKTRSNNKLRLKVKNIKFNYFSPKIELEKVVFYSNDSLDLATSYRFEVENIKLRVKALLPIFTHKELQIDSIYLTAPKIQVNLLKKPDTTGKTDVSIPEEMGRIYNSIIDALKLLQVTRFEFNDAQFTLNNKIHPEQTPLVITNMHMHIDNLKIDSTQDKNKFFFSDQMVFRTRNQDITFPDGNHQLAFSRFRINIRKKLIEIDSCTLSGKKTDSTDAAFRVFLDRLILINVDFNALYQKELIKADTVFCDNPKFKIELNIKAKTGKNANLPDLDKIIQQLTGDMMLNYINVSNAAIDITAYKNGKPTSFNSTNNNFEMEGLTIDQRLPHPVSLTGFSMAIRNYENYLNDSSYILRFDSILFKQNRILLSNFSVNTQPYLDNRNIKVQRFALSGLSWSDLLFDKKINAYQATLYSPVIDYIQPAEKRHKKSDNTFLSLETINNLMQLEQLQIVNGQINIKTRSKNVFHLENANLLLKTRSIVKSPEITNIEHSIKELAFLKGIIRLKGLVIKINDASFEEKNNSLSLGKLNFYNNQQTININVSGITLDSLKFNATDSIISATGMSWQKANIEINSLSDKKNKSKLPVSFLFENIKGTNTLINLTGEKNDFSATLHSVSARNISNSGTLVINDLRTTGEKFSSGFAQSELTIGNFNIADRQSSTFNSLRFIQHSSSDSAEVNIAQLSFIPDVNSIISGNTHLKQLKIVKPEIKIKIYTKDSTPIKNRKPLPLFTIDQVKIDNPKLDFENKGINGIKQLVWNGQEADIVLKNIKTNNENSKIEIGSLKSIVSDFSVQDKNGKWTTSREGKLDAQLENIFIQPGDSLRWQVVVKEIKATDFGSDSIGKNPAHWKIKTGKIENLKLSSGIISALPKLIENNPEFSLTTISGQITDDKNKWYWNNFSYHKKMQTATLDTFSYTPVLSRDSFIAANPYQTDFMTLQTAGIKITKFNLDHYLADSVFQAGALSITNPYFTSYRDKRPPFHAGIIKPFLTKMFQKISVKFSLDTIKINNGTVVYTELNDKTKEAGIIPVTGLTGDIFPVKNINLTEKDSLRIRLNGFLMDSAWIRLRVRESYLDSLSGFLITLRLRPGSLMYLNPVLAPLASVKLQSGYLDTLTMRAIGRDDLSLGEMRMYYHDLKVQFLTNGSESKKRFLSSLMTFIANSFVIKRKNEKRVGVVYFPRLRDRSFINYYIKIVMSGVASSVGAKKNRKLLRRYQKQIKIRQLPPIDFE